MHACSEWLVLLQRPSGSPRSSLSPDKKLIIFLLLLLLLHNLSALLICSYRYLGIRVLCSHKTRQLYFVHLQVLLTVMIRIYIFCISWPSSVSIAKDTFMQEKPTLNLHDLTDDNIDHIINNLSHMHCVYIVHTPPTFLSNSSFANNAATQRNGTYPERGCRLDPGGSCPRVYLRWRCGHPPSLCAGTGRDGRW